jgi:hypothetical protein
MEAVEMSLRFRNRKDFGLTLKKKKKEKINKEETQKQSSIRKERDDNNDVTEITQLHHKKKRTLKILTALDFLPNSMFLEHPLKFESVKAFKGISDLKTESVHQLR